MATDHPPHDSADLLQQGLTYHQAGDLESAQAVYQALLHQMPHHPQGNYLSAALLLQRSSPEAALGYIETALEADPDNAIYRYHRALALEKLGHLKEAEAEYRRTVRLDPDFHLAHFNRAKILLGLERLEEARREAGEAVRLRPEHPGSHNRLGTIRETRGDPEAAMESYRQALTAEPRYEPALRNLGRFLRHREEAQTAVDLFRALHQANPDHIPTVLEWAVSLREASLPQEAVAAFDTALDLAPDREEALMEKGKALKDADRIQEALQTFSHALEKTPDNPSLLAQKGKTLLVAGRIEEAERSLKEAIRVDPEGIPPYYHLATLNAISPEDEEFHRLCQLPQDARLSPDSRSLAHFTLGDVQNHHGQWDQAFRHWQEGNRIHRETLDFDIEATVQGMEALREATDPGALTDLQGAGDPSERPVFIVGMARSGTTLVEQILAQHPQVAATGEAQNFHRLYTGIRQALGPGRPIEEWLQGLSPEDVREAAATFLRDMESRAGNASRLTNKLPLNFLYLGLIHLFLPNARIIHCLREPLDTCISLFSKRFEQGQWFSYDLYELGRYYRAYQQTMAFWRERLSQGTMLEISYEDLVQEPESRIQKLLNHIGLAWDPTCLNFHQQGGAVQTASNVQVRQPLYRSSINRWQRFEAFLAPLYAGLKGQPRPSGHSGDPECLFP